MQALERLIDGNNKNTQTKTGIQTKTYNALHDETEEWRSKDVRKPTLIHAITIQEQPADNRHPHSYAEIKWNPL